MRLRKLLTFSLFGIFISLCSFIKPVAVTSKCYTIKNIQDTVPNDDTSNIKIFAKVEIEASYPGGEIAWRNYLEKNINPAVAAKKKAPVGAYTVIVQFVVNTDGTISDITPLTNHGFGTEQEVIRVIKNAPRWKPAVQDGRKVRAYRKQPVTFQVAEEEKKKKSKDND